MPRVLPSLRSLALRFTLVGAAVLGLGGVFATAIVEPMVPLLGSTVAAVAPDFIFHGVAMDGESARTSVVFRANLRGVERVGNSFVLPFGLGSQPEGWYQVTLTTAGILQHALLLVIIVLAWPGTARELALRCLLAMPLALLLLLQHVAVTVPAELWFPIHDEFAPAEIWPLLAWSRFLMGGGGLVLAMALAALAIAMAARLERGLRLRTSEDASHKRQDTFTEGVKHAVPAAEK